MNFSTWPCKIRPLLTKPHQWIDITTGVLPLGLPGLNTLKQKKSSAQHLQAHFLDQVIEFWLTSFDSEHQYYLWLNLELKSVRIYSGTDRIGSESLMFRSNYRILKKGEGTKFYPSLKSFLQFHCCNNFSTFCIQKIFCIQTNQFLKFYRKLRPLSKYLQFHLRFSF